MKTALNKIYYEVTEDQETTEEYFHEKKCYFCYKKYLDLTFNLGKNKHFIS